MTPQNHPNSWVLTCKLLKFRCSYLTMTKNFRGDPMYFDGLAYHDIIRDEKGLGLRDTGMMSDDSLSKIIQTHKSRMTPVCFERACRSWYRYLWERVMTKPKGFWDYILSKILKLMSHNLQTLEFSLFWWAENIKYKFRFCLKFAQHMHRSVSSMGPGSCTFSSHLTWIGVWKRNPQPPEAGPSAFTIFSDLLPK